MYRAFSDLLICALGIESQWAMTSSGTVKVRGGTARGRAGTARARAGASRARTGTAMVRPAQIGPGVAQRWSGWHS